MGNTVNVSITINGVNGVSGKAGQKQERQPIDRTNEKLIDNNTSFTELLNILKHSPEAVEAEKSEIEEKMREAKEEKLRKLYGEDYDFVFDGAEDAMPKKEKRRPGAVQLRKFEPRVAMIRIGEGSCEVYSNGYAVYDNGDRKTVLWVPDCGSATYYFTQLKDNEKMYLKQKDDIGEDVFGALPWYIALTISGEDSIERNLIHPKSKGSASDADDPAEWDYLPDWRGVGGTKFPNPEEYVLKKEAEAERRRALTQKQRKAYDLYYGEGYSMEEIAAVEGVHWTTIQERINTTKRIFEKDKEKFFS